MKNTLGTIVEIMAVAILIGTFTSVPTLAGEKARDGRFIAYDNGTVLDTKTNLIWAAKDNGSNINWENAKIYCENYRGGGYTDWRLPTLDELKGLYDKTKTYKNKSGDDIHLTELIRLTDGRLWSSRTSTALGDLDAFYLTFQDGKTGAWPVRHPVSSTLPVRSGKVVSSGSTNAAQKTNVKEEFGNIVDKDGNSTTISVENGKELFLSSSDKHVIMWVGLSLSKANANKLVKMVEKAVADLAKPVQLANNQTIDKDYGQIQSGSIIKVKVTRDSRATRLWVSNYDSEIIRKVHLLLDEGQAQQYLEALQKAVKSMK